MGSWYTFTIDMLPVDVMGPFATKTEADINRGDTETQKMRRGGAGFYSTGRWYVARKSAAIANGFDHLFG